MNQVSQLAWWCLGLLLYCVNGDAKASAFDQANKRSVDGLSALPRFGYPEEMKATGDSAYQVGYVMGILCAVGIFFALSFLGIIFCPPWCIFRVCKCCCCKKTKHKKEFSCWNKWGFYGFIVLCCALMVSFVGIAYDANARFSEAVVNEDDGMLEIGATVLEEMRDFVDVVVFEPLAFISDHIVIAVDNVTTLLDGSDVIVNGTDGIVQSLYDFEEKWSNFTIVLESASGKQYSFPCDICTTIGGVVGDTAEKMESETQQIFDDLAETISTIKEELIQGQGDLVQSISNATSTMRDLTDTLDDYTTDFNDDYRPLVEDYNDQREQGYNIMFAVPLIPFIPVLLGGLLKWSFCFTLAYSLMWLSFVLMFFLMGLHLMVTLLLNDACNFLDAKDQNVTDYRNDTFGELLQSCFDNSKVAEAFGLDEFLDFDIPFPEFDKSAITNAFNFSALSDFEQQTSNSSALSVFGGLVDDSLEAIHELVAACTCLNDSYNATRNDTYVRQNLSELVAKHYFNPNSIFDEEVQSYSALWNLTNITLDIISAEKAGNLTLTNLTRNMQNDISAIQNQTGGLEADVNEYFGRINNSQSVLDPIFDKAEEVIEFARCGFIGVAYEGFKTNLCDNIVSALSTMVLCMLLIGIFSFLSCCFSIKMVRRIKPLMDYEGVDANTKPTPPVIVMTQQEPDYGTALYSQQ